MTLAPRKPSHASLQTGLLLASGGALAAVALAHAVRPGRRTSECDRSKPAWKLSQTPFIFTYWLDVARASDCSNQDEECLIRYLRQHLRVYPVVWTGDSDLTGSKAYPRDSGMVLGPVIDLQNGAGAAAKLLKEIFGSDTGRLWEAIFQALRAKEYIKIKVLSTHPRWTLDVGAETVRPDGDPQHQTPRPPLIQDLLTAPALVQIYTASRPDEEVIGSMALAFSLPTLEKTVSKSPMSIRLETETRDFYRFLRAGAVHADAESDSKLQAIRREDLETHPPGQEEVFPEEGDRYAKYEKFLKEYFNLRMPADGAALEEIKFLLSQNGLLDSSTYDPGRRLRKPSWLPNLYPHADRLDLSNGATITACSCKTRTCAFSTLYKDKNAFEPIKTYYSLVGCGIARPRPSVSK